MSDVFLNCTGIKKLRDLVDPDRTGKQIGEFVQFDVENTGDEPVEISIQVFGQEFSFE